MKPHDIAREYLGTRYMHQGRNAHGIDCVGLLICVARRLGAVPADFDINGYRREPDGFSLMHHLTERFRRIEEEEDMRPGDVVCVTFDRYPHHVGILGDYVWGGLSIIHAASKHGKVVETRLLFTQQMRFTAAFRFPEKR